MSKSPLLIAATRWEIASSLYQLPNVKILTCGIGAPNIRYLIEDTVHGPLISIGFAGGTHESLRPGDIVLANESLQISYNGTWKTQDHLVFPELNFGSFHDTFFEHSRIVWGKLGTVGRVVVTPPAKRHLGESRAVCAIDMESFAVANLAQKNNLPWIGIRIILDAMDEPLLGWKPWEFPSRVFHARKILGRFITEKLCHLYARFS